MNPAIRRPLTSRAAYPAGRTLWLAVGSVAFGILGAFGSAAQGADDRGDDVRDPEVGRLVRDLGSSHWELRETAQGRLLELGLDAVPRLEEAARSGNIELAHRARYILERIDPEVVELRILKIELGPPPVLRETASVVGSQSEQLVAKTSPTEINAPRFEATYREIATGRIIVEVARTVQGGIRVELPSPLDRPNAISIILRSEESTCRRMGLRLDRTRASFLTVAWIRRGRHSALGRGGDSPDHEVTLGDLVRALVSQAESADGLARHEAWRILAELSPPDAFPLFRRSTSTPETREAALLGLGEVGGLSEILTGTGEVADSPDRVRIPEAVTTAAIRLARIGNLAGSLYLVDRLRSADGLEYHHVAATLADLADGSLTEPLRSRLLAAALDRDALANAPWNDVETEHFYTRLVFMLDPKREADRGIVDGLLKDIEQILRADPTQRRPDAKTCMDLWRRTALRLPAQERPSNLSFLLRVLPAVRGTDAFADIMTLVEESFYASGAGRQTTKGTRLRSETVSRDELRALCDALCAHVESGDPDLAAKSHQWLIRLSRSFTPREGELGIVVDSLIRSAVAVSTMLRENADQGTGSGPTRFSIAQTEQELSRWTGLPLPRRSTSMAPDAGVEFDAAPWRDWLGSTERVIERERSLIDERASESSPRTRRTFVYYEFDLELVPFRMSSDKRAGAQSFRVLDGRRLEIPENEPVRYRDRWENELYAILEPLVTPGAPGLERVRLNRRSLLYVGVPVLTTVYERELETIRVEVSDVFSGSQPILHDSDSLSVFRNVLFVLPLDRDDVTGAAPTDPQALWKAFLESHILGLKPDASAQERTSVLAIVRAIDIPGRPKLLRRLFESAPSGELARLLHESGDTLGLQWLQQQLRVGVGKPRWDAALELSEMGDSEGARALLDEYRKSSAALKRYSYQILNALDGYLQLARGTDPVREQVLDFVFDQLEDPLFQYRAFRLVEREAGTDFGYRNAKASTDARETKSKVEDAIRGARAWRLTEKSGRR